MEVIVDNRLRMRLADVPKAAANELRAKFEHNNPEYHKKRQMGYDVGNGAGKLVVHTWFAEQENLL